MTEALALRPPALNHLYVVVDGPTFTALRDNAGVAALLGRTDGGLPDYAAPPGDTDRIFFRGRQTYLEIFAPQNRFDEPVGKVGLGLGLDTPADFDAMDAAWRLYCRDRFRRKPVAYRRTTPPTPWYDAIQCDDTAAGRELAVWAMIYRPEFHRWQAGAAASSAGRIARADILAPRACAGQGRFDIVGLTLALSPDLRDRLVAQLVAGGFERRDLPDAITLKGDGLNLRFVPTTQEAGLLAVDFTVTSRLPVELPLGAARLGTVGNARATLRFFPDNAEPPLQVPPQ